MPPESGVGSFKPLGVGVIPVHHAGSPPVEVALRVAGYHQPRYAVQAAAHPRLLRILAELAQLLAIHVHHSLVGRSDVTVAIFGGASDRGGAEPTHPYRRIWLLHRTRRDPGAIDMKMLAVEGDLLSLPKPPNDLQRLIGTRAAGLEIDSIAGVFLGTVSKPDPQIEPPVGNYVQYGAVFGQPDRIVQRQDDDVSEDPHLPGARCDGSGRDQRRRNIVIVGKVMFKEEGIFEADRFRPHHVIDDVGISRRRGPRPLRRVAKIRQ